MTTRKLELREWLDREFVRVKCPKCKQESEILESYKNQFLKDGCHECRGGF